MPSSLRERRRQLLRDEILDAARNLLSDKGYTAMSMDDLAARAGISKPTLYSYFETKEALVVAAIMREFERITAMLTADLAHETPLQRLSLVLRTIVRLRSEQPDMSPRAMGPELMHVLFSHQEAANYMRRLDAAALALVQAAMAQGEIDSSLDSITVTRAFYAIANCPKMPFLNTQPLPSAEAVADTLVMLWERGVQPATTANGHRSQN